MSLVDLSRASFVYGLGFLVLFVMFMLLYAHAYRRRHDLELSALDEFDVKMYAGHYLVSAGVGFLAVTIALLAPLKFAPLSPMSFALMGPAHWAFGRAVERRRNTLLEMKGSVERDATV